MSRKAKAAPEKGLKFPKRIFVKWDDTTTSLLDDPYLVASEVVDGFEDKDRVAVYELVETHTLKVTRRLS